MHQYVTICLAIFFSFHSLSHSHTETHTHGLFASEEERESHKMERYSINSTRELRDAVELQDGARDSVVGLLDYRQTAVPRRKREKARSVQEKGN